MSKIDYFFSIGMILFGFYVMCVANAAIYAPYDAVGYVMTLGFIASVVGIHQTVAGGKK